MPLSGDDFEKLRDAILASFVRNQFEVFLRLRVGRKLEEITGASGFDRAVFDVVDAADREDWLDELLAELRKARPRRADLFRMAGVNGLAVDPPPKSVLEGILTRDGSGIDVPIFLSRLAAIEATVCHVSYEVELGRLHGTGFLVGPDQILTNHHVVSLVLDGKAAPGAVEVTFGFRRRGAGSPPEPGTTFALAKDWIVDSSPCSPLDVVAGGDEDAMRDPDHLDHALLRLAGPAGDLPIGKRGEDGSPRRGWLSLSTEALLPRGGETIFILQHPRGRPITIAANAVRGVNRGGTRLRYGVGTEPGSSGSPCFNARMEPVAIHHAGDPDYTPLSHGKFNQGIPLAAIRARLERLGIPIPGPDGGSVPSVEEN